MTARRRLAPIILTLAVLVGLAFGLEANINTTPEIGVIDAPALSIEGN